MSITCDTMQSEQKPSIVKWCENQTVFITGGSGFLGKALIFKLLKCHVNKIYVLIRNKKGVRASERLDHLMNHEIYESLRKNDPDLRSKLVAIEGDVTEPDLGITDDSKNIIRNEVTAIFHVAASVKFDDPLKQAIHYNLRSTRDLLELAKTVKHLEVFHYVSTAYSNCDHMNDPLGVEEKIYPRKMDPGKLIEFVDSNPDAVVNALGAQIIGTSPNTYVFTKHLAEALVNETSHLFPVVISRPEIVLPAVSEPIPGWLDNISSPAAIVGACGKGVLRLYIGPNHAPKAYVAVDMTINAIIVSSWKQALQKERKALIYNMEYTPISSARLKRVCFIAMETHPLHASIWNPRFITVENEGVFLIAFILLHLIPGLLFDTVLKLTGNKPRLVRLYRKLYLALLALLPILRMYDNFVFENYVKLKADIPLEEKDTFTLDTIESDEEYIEYMKIGSIGFRKLIGDPAVVTKDDIKHFHRLRLIDNILQTAVYIAIMWYFPFGRLWNSLAIYAHNYWDNITI